MARSNDIYIIAGELLAKRYDNLLYRPRDQDCQCGAATTQYSKSFSKRGSSKRKYGSHCLFAF